MNTLLSLVVAAVVVNGIIAGISFDVATVKLPTRRRIGVAAYAQFARGNDMGNGMIVYPTVAILGLLLVAAATLVALRDAGAWYDYVAASCSLCRDSDALSLHCEGGSKHVESEERFG